LDTLKEFIFLTSHIKVDIAIINPCILDNYTNSKLDVQAESFNINNKISLYGHCFSVESCFYVGEYRPVYLSR